MRVSQKTMIENAIHHMNDNLELLQGLQEKVSTGKEFQHPSDNPSGVATVLNLRTTLEASKSYLNTASSTDGWLTATDDALSQMLDVAKQVIQLAKSGISDTEGSDQREEMAQEMNILLQQSVDIGNTTHLGNHLFAGFQTNIAPFVYQYDASGTIIGVNYSGDNGIMLRTLGPGLTIPQNTDGEASFSELFRGIISARDALLTNDSDTIQASVPGLENALNTINEASTINGARQRQTRIIQDRLDQTQLELKSLLSKKEDTNLAEAISMLKNQETVYQSVLEVGNRAISALNLFSIMS
jgi:flagellar hook-associated protein 3 FlgL